MKGFRYESNLTIQWSKAVTVYFWQILIYFNAS